MAPSPRLSSYEDRFNRVVDYIYDHLDHEISIDTLAGVACLSPFHWHRIYTAMRGETIAATIKRLRLQRAADRLANSETAVVTIAKTSGYGSVEAFSRAFKEVYDQAPATYRASGSHAVFKMARLLEDAAGFPVTVERLPETRCVSVAHSGSYMQIDRAMGRLFNGLASRGLLTQEARMIGVYLDDPEIVPVTALRSLACSPVADNIVIAEDFGETILRGGLYAQLRYQGPYADMTSAYRWLWGVWLPQSGYEPASAPVFEAYLNSPEHVAPSELVTVIHLPLEPAI